MYIGELSKTTGASVKAIRLYEEMGLLSGVQRRGKYRVYDASHQLAVRLIVQAKGLGFSLREIRRFRAQTAERSPWQSLLAMLDEKRAQIDGQIAALQAQRATLEACRTSIEACLAENADCALDQAALDSAPGGRL